MKLSLTYAANGDNYEAIERCLKSATPHRPNPHPPLPPAPPRSTPAAAILIPMSPYQGLPWRFTLIRVNPD